MDGLFKGRHFDQEIIVLCVRWYLRYKLSFRDLVEMMAERGLSLAHTTIMRWIQCYVPEFEKRWNRFARPAGRSWRVDETYVKIRGRWTYLYRAVDKEGNTVDFLLRAKRDVAAAKAFFRRALQRQGQLPHKITLDGYQASHRGAAEALSEHPEGNQCEIRSSKYVTDVFDKGLPRPHGGLVVVQANAERFPSRRAAGEATRTAKSGSVTRLPRDRRRLALTERARRYRSRPGGWTTIAIVLGYCSSGDHVAKSRVEVPALSRSL
jgi:transposase-like protein